MADLDDDVTHLDTFRMADLGGPPEDEAFAPEEPAAEVMDAEPEQMDKEAFWVVFQACFSLPAGFWPDMAPLAIQPEEMQVGRQASDACHDLLSIYYPKALMPQGETVAALLVAGPFLLAKVMVVRMVLQERRRKRAEAARIAYERQFGGVQEFRSGRAAPAAPEASQYAPAPAFDPASVQ